MEKKIKFSEEYEKLKIGDNPIPNYAVLMEVFKVQTKDLHKRFVEYDTIYFDKKINNWAYYKLPEGEVLILLFKSDDLIFTTIRRYTPEKYKYYLENRWESFKIDLQEEARHSSQA